MATAAIPEVFTDPTHPRGTTAKDVMWSKCKDVLKLEIMLDDIENAADLLKWLSTEQCYLFQNYIILFLDTLIQKIKF